MKKPKKEFDLLMPKRAGIWRRIFAFIIDLLIIYLATSPLQSLVAKEIGLDNNLNINSLKEIFSEAELFGQSSSLIVSIAILIAIAGMIYWTLLEYLLKQSVGKMLMKIAIKSQASELRLWQVIVRNITKATSVTSLSILFLIDIIYMFFNQNRQRLTEVLSKTEVIEL